MADAKNIQANVKVESAKDDLTATGRKNTEVATQTVVEDRTEAPAQRIVKEYKSETRELDGGTILTSYTDEVKPASKEVE